MRKKFLSIIVLSLCIISAIFYGFTLNGNNIKDVIVAQTPTPAPTARPDDKVKFIAAGDNLIHGSIYLQAARRGKDGHYDFDYAYENVVPYLKNFDLRFINQETIVTDLPPATYPRFSSPWDLGKKVIDMGFEVIGTSNNHSYDKGVDGINKTLEFWNSTDVVHTGYYTGNDDYDIKYKTVNNIKIAFLAYTYGTNGLSIPKDSPNYIIRADNFEVIERQVKIAKEKADVVIVSCHWGFEDTNKINDYQKNVALNLNKMGVDVIIGTHPHVIQPVEWFTNEENDYKTLICYSLGNFISAQSKANNMLGGLFEFDIIKKYDIDGNSKVVIESPYFTPTVTHYDANYSNIRNYILKDYTSEMALSHGVRAFDAKFSLEYLNRIVENIISNEFIKK